MANKNQEANKEKPARTSQPDSMREAIGERDTESECGCEREREKERFSGRESVCVMVRVRFKKGERWWKGHEVNETDCL